MGAALATKNQARPLIFEFHNYREFLISWTDYILTVDKAKSLRALSRQAKLSPGYLPLVLAGHRSLSHKSTAKLLPHLGLKPNEQSYFKLLVKLDEAKTHDERSHALKQIQRFNAYRSKNNKELEAYVYLSHWYIVAIRELVSVVGFQWDAKWIQSHLNRHVSLIEIKKSMEFLVQHGFVILSKEGTASVPAKSLDCLGGIFQIALSDYHKEMLVLAAESIDQTEKEKRSLTGYTFAIASENIDNVKKIIAEAQAKIVELERGQKISNAVYHLEFSFFPLSEEVKS